jgi:CO/xanthine dehydrogenase FAD-binding subunit
MSNPSIEAFHRPRSIERVWQLLEEGGPSIRLVGGGTDLAIRCPPEVQALVDMTGLGLDRIVGSGDGTIRVGAMATLTKLLEHPLTSEHAGGVMTEMLVHVGSPLLRNAATIGGHLARGRLSDVVPVCLALDAGVVVYDGEYHSMELDSYYRRLAHRAPHVLTEVTFPPLPARSATSFLRFSRSAFDHALVNVACRADMEDGIVSRARVAVGASFGPASLMPGAESLLVGSSLDDEVIDEAASTVALVVDVDPTWMVGDDYRRHLAETLVRRSLNHVRHRLGGAP